MMLLWEDVADVTMSQTHFAYVVAENPAVPKQPKQPRVDKEEIIRKLEVYKYLRMPLKG